MKDVSGAAEASALGDAALLRGVLLGDAKAWRELVRRHEPGLREVVHEAAPSLTDDQTDDVLGDFWLLLLEDDLRRLRRIRVTQEGGLSTWLGLVASQLACNQARRLAREPRFVPLEQAPEAAIAVRTDDSPMFDVETVARRWGVNVKTIYSMIQRGEIRAARFGRLVRIPRRVVESFEQGRAVSGGK